MLKRFVIFAYASHEASGGWNDIIWDHETGKVKSFDTEAEAEVERQKILKENCFDNVEITDLHNDVVVP